MVSVTIVLYKRQFSRVKTCNRINQSACTWCWLITCLLLQQMLLEVNSSSFTCHVVQCSCSITARVDECESLADPVVD